MTTYRVKHNKEHPYVKIDKGFLQSPNLSAKAKGILAYLLSLPSDWRICLSHLVKVFSDGETSIRSGLAELKQAGYLTKASIRDRTGQIVSWVTDVYETPHHFDKNCDRNGNFSLVKSPPSCDRDSYPDVDFPQLDNLQLDNPHLENLHLDNPHLDNRSQLINKDPLRNKFTNPPFPSQLPQQHKKGEGEIQNYQFKIQNWESSRQFVGREQLASTDLLVKTKDPVEESPSATVSTNDDNVTHCEAATPTAVELLTPSEPPDRVKRYDRSLGIKEPEEWKSLQQKQFDWVPNGPWLIENKLDPNFIDWLAKDWQKEYGGTIHKKRSDVLRHFKKDPANIAIAWEQYSSEHLHRYTNAAVRMDNGLEIQPDEQQQLLTHARAVANPLPDELNPVASAVEVPQSMTKVAVFLPDASQQSDSASQEVLERLPVGENASAVCGVEPTCTRSDSTPETTSSPSLPLRGSQVPKGRNRPSGSPLCHRDGNRQDGKWTHQDRTGEAIRPTAGGDKAPSSPHLTDSSTFPTDDDGCAENPDAYQEWFSQPPSDQPVCASVFSEKLAAFNKKLSMSPKRSQQQQQTSSESELEELNRWLDDPILRSEAMARVMRSEIASRHASLPRMGVEFDEDGNPIKVGEVTPIRN
jgi:hypothetical protein